MVTSTLSVSPSGSISTKETENITTKSSKVDLRCDTVHKLGKKLVIVESNGESILYCLMRSLCPHQKTVTVQGELCYLICIHMVEKAQWDSMCLFCKVMSWTQIKIPFSLHCSYYV